MYKAISIASGIAFSLAASAAGAFQTEMLQNAGPSARRVNIVILGDGYRAQDQALLTERAQVLMSRLWKHPAFGDYKTYYNVKLIHTISDDRGAINGQTPPSKPTIFKSFFNCDNTPRLLCIGDTQRLVEVLAEDAPEYDSNYDVVLVAVNDAMYGGSGGQYATTSADAAAPEITVHELGHTLGKLADEYDYDKKGTSSVEFGEANATIYSEREKVKWNAWLDRATPVPTPVNAGYSDVTGVFLGAHYYAEGAYRPAENCEMRNLGREFCSICGEALISSVYNKVDPIDQVSPRSANVSLRSNARQTFSFAGPRPTNGPLSVDWTLDGKAVSTSANYEFVASSVGVGKHTLTLRVRDQTPRVRRDPKNLLSSTFSWSVSVTN